MIYKFSDDHMEDHCWIQRSIILSSPRAKYLSMNFMCLLWFWFPNISFIFIKIAPFCLTISGASIGFGSSSDGLDLFFLEWLFSFFFDTLFSLLGDFFSFSSYLVSELASWLKLNLLPPHQHFLSSLFSIPS